MAGETTLAQCLAVVQKLVFLVQPLLIWRPLEDTLSDALQLKHRARLLGLSEDGGLAAPDHDEHVHCSCLSPLTANPGGLNEGFYNRDSKVGL